MDGDAAYAAYLRLACLGAAQETWVRWHWLHAGMESVRVFLCSQRQEGHIRVLPVVARQLYMHFCHLADRASLILWMFVSYVVGIEMEYIPHFRPVCPRAAPEVG